MLRAGQVIRRRRAGEVVSEIRPDVPVIRKRPPVKVKASRWGSVSMADERAAIDRPKRKQLSEKQWAKRGDYLRVLKGCGYEGADQLSLDDCKTAYYSTVKMCKYRCMIKLASAE